MSLPIARKNLVAAGFACALLSACATSGAPPSAQPVAPYRDSVELAGRLSVNYQRDGKPESLSGKFVWRQAGQRIDVSLASPLGQTIAVIGVEPGLATLTQGGQAPRSAADIDSLSAQALGWPLPVSGLRDWLQGYAQDADGKRFAASPLQASVTTRDGWRLHFVSWQDGATPRPKRIDAERGAGAQSEAVAIRIVIDPVQP
jgi:outer membrane lipoprotein LolB